MEEMTELAKPYPGWRPPFVRPHECFRQAFCCAAGLHPIRVKWIDPADDAIDFWGLWQQEFLNHGFRFRWATLSEAETSGLFWIAGVRSLHWSGSSHAITMKGGALHYDSNMACAPHIARKQRPHKFTHTPVIPVPLA
jgi:hypothetical protein